MLLHLYCAPPCKFLPALMVKCIHILSIVKATRCASVSNLFYFGMTLCMFWTIFLSIIRSSRLNRYCCLLASKQTTDKFPLLYVQSSTPDDGQKDHPKHVQCHSKINFDTLVHLVGFTIEIILWYVGLRKSKVYTHYLPLNLFSQTAQSSTCINSASWAPWFCNREAQCKVSHGVFL